MFFDFQNSQTFVLVDWILQNEDESESYVRQALALADESEVGESAEEILAELLKERVEVALRDCPDLDCCWVQDMVAVDGSLVGRLLEVIVPDIKFKVAAEALLIRSEERAS